MLAVALCFTLAAAPLALARAPREPSAKQEAQLERMKDCDRHAGDKQLKADERKKFMSTCLKG